MMFLRRLLRNRSATIGCVVVALFLLTAALADVMDRYEPLAQKYPQLERPTGPHWLGTDDLGRDVWARICHGARVSLQIGVVSVLLSALVGVPIGCIAGYAGRWIDAVLMRVMDVLLAFPGILLALAIVAFLGSSLVNLMIAIAIVNVPAYARQVRASVLVQRELDYVAASRALGAGHARVLFRHILPNCLGPILVLSTLGIATAILEAAGLGFVGLGLEEGRPEWGMMLAESRQHFLRAPWVVLGPGVAITVTVLGFNLFGDGLRDLLDPRGRRR